MVDETTKPENITDADWAIINARFKRLERTLEYMQTELSMTTGTANRADQRGSAHQPFIDQMAENNATGTGVLDGRTFMTLVRWVQYIEQCARPLNALQKRPSRNMPVTVIVSPGEYDELKAALTNASSFLEGVTVLR